MLNRAITKDYAKPGLIVLFIMKYSCYVIDPKITKSKTISKQIVKYFDIAVFEMIVPFYAKQDYPTNIDDINNDVKVHEYIYSYCSCKCLVFLVYEWFLF